MPGFILHQVACRNNCVRRTVVCPYAFNYGLEGIVGIQSSHHGIRVRMQVRIRDVQ
jgi:hypothetical protein